MTPDDEQSSNAHDHAIDAALAVLREAARPSSSLEQRVLQNLAEQTARAPRPGWRLAWFALPAAACAALAMISVPALRHPHSSPSPVASAVANRTPLSPDSVPVSHQVPTEQILVRAVPSQHRPARAHRITLFRESTMAAARADTPPPPAPLTEQERLLLQIARSGDPGQRAMLNPEVLARQESEEDAQFRNFFAKSSNVQTRNP